MKTLNDLVCTTPFPFTGLQTQERASGLRTMATATVLVGLRVLAYGPDGLRPGDVVFVKAGDVKTPYGSTKFKLPSGDEAIFVPKMNILMSTTPEPAGPLASLAADPSHASVRPGV